MGIFSFLKKDNSEKRLAIMDVNDDNFKQQVIQRSYKTTVIVDYWAAWCMPCRQLGPTLEKIAEDPTSDFILAKLNTEHNQKTAAQFNIRSIPNVKAFRNGQIVNEFTGALPETLVRRFVNKISESPPPPPRLQISANPNKRLQQGKQHLKKGRGFEAYVILNEFPDSPQAEEAEQLLPLARFLFDIDDGDGLTGIDDLDKAYLNSANAMKKNRPADVLENLFTALETGEKIDEAHTLLVIDSLFALYGEDHAVTIKYRDLLASAQ
ncbi:MAG TPA: thioredoxin domain-containing protein [Patescibacteria group bacterium]|jgi:putative thioredoxin|nr:thioredoxin domain-containing protein [Patescibacteria group bacterium]